MRTSRTWMPREEAFRFAVHLNGHQVGVLVSKERAERYDEEPWNWSELANCLLKQLLKQLGDERWRQPFPIFDLTIM